MSGQGTTHCTNGIVIQRQVAGCEPPPIIRVQDKQSVRRRAFPVALSPVQEFNAGRRVGPELYGLDVQLVESPEGHYEAKLPLKILPGFYHE